MNILYLIVTICVVLMSIKVLKNRRKKAASNKKRMYLERCSTKEDNGILVKEIEKIKCKEIIKN